MSEPLLLGVDVGTSALKAAVFDLEGSCVAESSQPIPLSTPADGVCEVDPRSYWDALRGSCADVWAAGVHADAVRALAIAANAETILALDEHLEPVRPGIVWVDTRSVPEAAYLAERFGASELSSRSGQPQMIPMWPATKILWLRRHEPVSARATRWWLQPLDYLVARLTGSVASDPSEYSSSLLLDIAARSWWQPMLDELSLNPSSLPELVPSTTPIGALTGQARDELGLAAHTVVVMGGFDQACTAVGAGNVAGGIVSESTGTSLAAIATVPAPPASGGTVPCHVHVVPEAYFLCAHNPSGGSVLEWFRGEFAPGRTLAELDVDAAAAPPGSEGLVVLPYFSGTATPAFDAAARGVFFGLTLRHTPAHVARAILEGVAFALAELLDAERALGVEAQELRSVGGGAKSAVWSQIKADVTGLPVVKTTLPDHAGALGAAVLAGVGARLLPAIGEGAATMVHLAERFEPDPERVADYAAVREVYRELYPRLEGVFAR